MKTLTGKMAIEVSILSSNLKYSIEEVEKFELVKLAIDNVSKSLENNQPMKNIEDFKEYIDSCIDVNKSDAENCKNQILKYLQAEDCE